LSLSPSFFVVDLVDLSTWAYTTSFSISANGWRACLSEDLLNLQDDYITYVSL
jgi:hypothetical protein